LVLQASGSPEALEVLKEDWFFSGRHPRHWGTMKFILLGKELYVFSHFGFDALDRLALLSLKSSSW
jgi:hypothetical protein